MPRQSIASDDPPRQALVPQRPKALPVAAENIPDDLRSRRQWVLWRYEWDARRRKWVKPPYTPATQQPAKVTDASTWGSYQVALAAATAEGWDGIGFVFTALDDLVGVDVDDCRDLKSARLAGGRSLSSSVWPRTRRSRRRVLV